ncbi:MAG: FecR family protein [Armatimonadota bacterium]
MKRNITALFLVTIFLFSALTPLYSAPQDGKLHIIKGTVIYKMPGQAQWSKLTGKSMELPVGTVIQTKENSKAILKFANGGEILIGEMTLFKIQTREDSESKTVYTLRLFGKTFIEVKKNSKNSFKIQTPTALATIRGSKMLVDTGDNLLTSVTSTEGTIEVTSTYLCKGRVLYSDGNKITLETDEGIKKINLDSDTIVAERNGQSEIKPGDRIAVYGRETENLQASTSPLALSNFITAGMISGTGAARSSITRVQAGMFMAQPSNTYQSPTGNQFTVQTVFVSPIDGQPAVTRTGTGTPPSRPAPAPFVPNNLTAAANQTPPGGAPAGAPAGADPTTAEGISELTTPFTSSAAPDASSDGDGIGTGTGDTGGGTTGVAGGAKPSIPTPPLISPSSTTGTVQLEIR